MRVTRLSRAIRASKFRENPITIYTDSVTPDVFDPSWAFSDASLMTVDWGDGTPIEFHATGLSHTYAAAGRKTVKFTCPDWGKVTQFDINTDVCRLALPAFANCVNLTSWLGNINQFNGYVGGFATQKNLATLNLATNTFPVISIDNILADLVTSLTIPGRVVCTLTLNGVGNDAPSNPVGLASKATLIAAGWTVNTN